MALYKNLTGETSRIGRIAKVSPTDPHSFVYANSSDTNVLGVITQAVPKYAMCEIKDSGVAKVYVAERTVKGATIRLQKSGDKISRATCKTAKSTDVPYLRIGTALQEGKGLVDAVVAIEYLTSDGITHEFLKTDQTTQQTTTGTLHFPTATFGGSTDYSEFESDGVLHFNGTAVVWDDVRIVPSLFDVPGGTDPDVNTYQPGGSGTSFLVYAFAKGDSGYFTIQMPHDYKEGTDLKAHVHWTPGARGIAENGHIVQWRLDYSFAAENGNFPASSTIAIPDACDGTNHKHQRTDEVTISGTGLGMSSQMIGRIYRWNDASDTWAGTTTNLPIFIEFDLHYQKDTCGSRESLIK